MTSTTDPKLVANVARVPAASAGHVSFGNKSLDTYVKLGGGTPESEVEVDETWVGGKARKMHKARRLRYEQLGGHHGKAVVQGILDRDVRKIRATVVPNTTREVLQNKVLHNVNTNKDLRYVQK